MLRIIRKSTSRPSFMYDMNFSLIYSISCRQRPPYVLSFKVKRQSLNSRGNRPLIPHRKNFSLANSCSSLKPPLINFRVFLFFSNIFRFFFQNDPYTLQGSSEDIFCQKIVHHTERPIFCKSQQPKCITKAMVPKSKKGKAKNEKVCWGSVGF